jgi:hypothetical protein
MGDATEEVNVFIGMKLRHVASCRVLWQALHGAGGENDMQVRVNAIDKMNGNIQTGAGALTNICIFLYRP